MSHNKVVKFLFSSIVFFTFFFSSHKLCDASTTKTYDIGKQDVKITKSGDYIITGSTKVHTITIGKGVKATITLKDVSIINEKEIDNINIKSGATVNLILTGTNNIENTRFYSAIHVPYGAKLTISEKTTGTLKASANSYGAAIGGSQSDSKAGTGTIIINGGTIEAIGGSDCGIGGGSFDRLWGKNNNEYLGGGDITINGGTVTAIGGSESCAGIGGASIVRQGKITINGGIVIASSGEAGIGGEHTKSKGNIISITGGTVMATGNTYAAAIGNNMNPKGTTVTITGGMVTAKGDYGDRLLYEGGMGDSDNFRDELKAYDIAADKIVIDGGNINAYTFSSNPTNKAGQAVYSVLLNLEKKRNLIITTNKISYGSKDIISNGYLSLYLPITNSPLTITSGKTTLFGKYVNAYFTPHTNSVTIDNFTANLAKGDLTLIEGGCIYNNKVYRCDNITVTGTTSDHHVFVHKSSNTTQTLIFRDLTVNYTNKGSKDFLIIDNDVSLTINLQGKNNINLGDQARGIFVGHDATLTFTGATKTDMLMVTAGENTNAIYTNIGAVEICGGNISFNLGTNSTAVYAGNYGTFTQYNGTFEAHGEKSTCISGASNFLVNIYGGTLIADTLGMYENANEEVENRTKFMMTGGNVFIANRIIFSDYRLYGGELTAKILGCGTGCNVTIQNGKVELGTFINYQYDDEGNPIIIRDIKTENIIGGTVLQRDDVPEEEVKQISFGTC